MVQVCLQYCSLLDAILIEVVVYDGLVELYLVEGVVAPSEVLLIPLVDLGLEYVTRVSTV